MEQDGIEFELVAASLRADASDSKAFLAALATKLSGALPQQTSVGYRGGMFGKKTVASVEVDLGDLRFRIEENRGRVEASCQKVVRGIVLKRETMPLDDWIDGLSRSVTEQARTTESGSMALRRMLEGR